jgi:hypothetical protein
MFFSFNKENLKLYAEEIEDDEDYNVKLDKNL